MSDSLPRLRRQSLTARLLGGEGNSSNLTYHRQQSPSAPPATVDDRPVSHLHLKESSSISSKWRNPASFTITRLESSTGLPDRITKVSSVPALIVSVSIKSLAIENYQLWVDDKLVPTPYIPGPTRSILMHGLVAGLEVRSTTTTTRFRARRWTICRSQCYLAFSSMPDVTSVLSGLPISRHASFSLPRPLALPRVRCQVH